MHRFDALGGAERAPLFGGATLHGNDDEVLQRLVEEAAQECGTPIAAVTLIVDRIQHFRAHVGLPRELAISRAVDRDTSFCQVVVRDEAPLEVRDAPEDERVPQELVDRFGIRSYLGTPVRIGGKVVGALCVIDLEARGFEDTQREALQALAERVTSRLDQLATPRPDTAEIATRPAFAELRESLAPMQLHLAEARVAVAELAPLARVTERLAGSPEEAARALSLLVEAAGAARHLEGLLDSLDLATARIASVAAALEGTMVARRGKLSVADLIQHASHLSNGVAELAGGIRWPDADPLLFVHVDRRSAITDMTALVVVCAGLLHARGHTAGMEVELGGDSDGVSISIAVPGVASHDLRRALVPVLLAESGTLRVGAERVDFVLPRG